MSKRVRATCLLLFTVAAIAGCMRKPPRHILAFENHLAIASDKYEADDYHGARLELDFALKIVPASQHALIRRASVNARLGDTNAAMADFNLAIALEPANALAHIGRGVLRRKMNDLKGSLDDLDRAVALAPELPESYAARGATRASLGDMPNAIEDFTRALSLNPTMDRAHLWRAYAFVATKRINSAALDLNEVLSRSEDPVLIKSAEALMDKIRPEIMSVK